MMGVEFTERTKTFGWGSFDPAVWQDQIDLHDELKQFPAGKPKLDQVVDDENPRDDRKGPAEDRLRRSRHVANRVGSRASAR